MTVNFPTSHSVTMKKSLGLTFRESGMISIQLYHTRTDSLRMTIQYYTELLIRPPKHYSTPWLWLVREPSHYVSRDNLDHTSAQHVYIYPCCDLGFSLKLAHSIVTIFHLRVDQTGYMCLNWTELRKPETMVPLRDKLR